MCQRKISPWQQEYGQESQNPGGRGRGDVDVEWTMPLAQINTQAGRFEEGDLSMNVDCPSSVEAFCSLSPNISHRHVHSQASWPESPLRAVSHSAPHPGHGRNSLAYWTTYSGLLKGQRGPCRITEKGYFKNPLFLQKHGPSLQLSAASVNQGHLGNLAKFNGQSGQGRNQGF